MLKISRLSDYAIVAMTPLAQLPGKRMSAKTLAEITHLKLPVVSKVLKQLAKAGLLKSELGPAGGYLLARPAHQITVAEMIAAVEGQMALTECGQGEAVCEHDHVCSLKGHWRMINQLVTNVLTQVTLQDLIHVPDKPIHFYANKLAVGKVHEC
ncbi:MAG TPA: SUF system Fe-S cluster assembly regulator [Coxiellaceae bacterium]|nr:SUF system Fe-S cluster assembly regulator [Coxiellaceae bacterium]